MEQRNKTFGCDICGQEFDIDEPIHEVNVGNEVLIMCTKCFRNRLNKHRNKTYSGGHIETATEAGATESPNKRDLNSRYGVMGRAVRPMIQFVPMSDLFPNSETTEERLKDTREQMTFTRAKKTIRRTGWYFTESYAPCGEFPLIKDLERLTTMFGNEKDWVLE